MARLVVLLLAVILQKGSCNYALGDPAPLCWKLAPGNPPITCPKGLGIDWAPGFKPPAIIPVGSSIDARIDLNITVDTLNELQSQSLIAYSADPTFNATRKYAACFKQNDKCSSTKNKDDCCFFHVNVHSCLNKPGTFCGPWIGNDGFLATHTPAQSGFAGTTGHSTWKFPIKLFWEGAYTIIAHFKFAKMHFAVGLTTTVMFSDKLCGTTKVPAKGGGCEPCPPGSQPLSLGIPKGGRQLSDDQAFKLKVNPLCVPCPGGWYSPIGTECLITDSGYFQENVSQISQLPCPAGLYTPLRGSLVCHECGKGQYSGSAQAACDLCKIGRYGDTPGRSQCKNCTGLAKTTEGFGMQSSKDCVCPVGTFDGGGGSASTCEGCSEGMSCTALGLLEPKQAAGYFIEKQIGSGGRLLAGGVPKYSVYRCRNTRECPFGDVGTCAKGRTGLMCSECMDGMVKGDNGKCEECKGDDLFPFTLAIVGIVVIVFLLYYVIDTENKAKQPAAFLLIGIVGGMCFTLIQQMAVFSTMAVDWVEPIQSMLTIMRFMNFDLEVLRIGCVATFAPVTRFAINLCAILGALTLVVSVHVVWVSVRHKGRFSDRMPSLIGVVGTIFMVFLTPIVNTAISPLQCRLHPNDLRTVVRFPTIVCGQDAEHDAVLVLALVFMILPLGFVTAACYVVYIFPRRMQMLDIRFLHAFAFLLFRFKVEVHWYTVFFILRNMLVALCPTLPEGLPQVIAMVILFVVSLTAVAVFFPWRNDKANYLDIIVTSNMIILLCGSGFLVRKADITAVAVLCSIVIVSNFSMFVGIILYALGDRFRLLSSKPFKYFICHHKGGAGATARIMKMELLQQMKSDKGVFIDCDDLNNTEMLFEYVGSHSECVVALQSKELLLRPWCIGELVTAHLNTTKIVPVIFPDFVAPDDLFIQNYADNVDVSALGPRGIGIEHIQAMFAWLLQIPGITIPSDISGTVMKELALAVASNVGGGKGGSVPTSATNTTGLEVLTIADYSNMEGIATALVLCKFLSKLNNHDASMIPQLLGSQESVPASAKTIIFILSNGVFTTPQFLRGMIEAAKLQTRYIPIIAEDGFRFPSTSMVNDFKRSLPAVLKGMQMQVETGQVITLIQDLFKEIAVVFAPQDYSSTEALLKVKSANVAWRLSSKSVGTLSLKAEPTNLDGIGGEDVLEFARQLTPTSALNAALDREITEEITI